MKLRAPIGVLLIAAIFASAAFLLYGLPLTLQGESSQTLHLSAPSLITSVKAQDGLNLGKKLDEEAGISAYYKASFPINLNQVVTAFRTIESQTANYIIGSVAVTGYAEHFDAHVYIDKDGWVIAYYLKQDPISKIVDQRGHTITTTKLKTVVATVTAAAGVPFTDISYYDFRYPNATNILLVAENGANGSDFSINMPMEYGYYERGWALHELNSGPGISVNGTDLTNSTRRYYESDIQYGVLTASHLPSNTTNTINTGSGNPYLVLVIAYWEP